MHHESKAAQVKLSDLLVNNVNLDIKTKVRILYDVALYIEKLSRLPVEDNKAVMQRDIISQNIFLPADWRESDEKPIALVGENSTGFESLRPNDGTPDYYHQPPHSLQNVNKMDLPKMIWQWGILAYEVFTGVPFDKLTAEDRERVIKKRLKPNDMKMGDTWSKIWCSEDKVRETLFDLVQLSCWNPSLDKRPSSNELVQIMQWFNSDPLAHNNTGQVVLLITGKEISAPSTSYRPENPPNDKAEPKDRFQAFLEIIYEQEKNCKPAKRAELKALFEEAIKHEDWVERLRVISKKEREVWLLQKEKDKEYKQFSLTLYDPRHDTKLQLQQTAEKHFKSIPIPPRPTTSRFSDMMSGNIVFGEVIHSDIAPKKFLIEKMQELKANGFDTLFMEFLYYEDQHLLNNYFETGDMDPKLKTRLKYLDRHKRESNDAVYHKMWGENNYLKIVEAARAAGIRVVAIDTENVYGTQYIGPIFSDDEPRILNMNYTAHKIMKNEIDSGRTKKWCALMGIQHVEKVDERAPGIAEIMGARCGYLYDSNFDFLEQKSKDNYEPMSCKLNGVITSKADVCSAGVTVVKEMNFKGDVVIAAPPSESIPSFNDKALNEKKQDQDSSDLTTYTHSVLFKSPENTLKETQKKNEAKKL